MTDSEPEQRREIVDLAESRYETTRNPLYVWEAIHVCLGGSLAMPLPAWCTAYISEIATNLYRLSCGLDFRSTADAGSPRVDPDYAFKLVAQALLVSRQGKRNAFKELKNDVDKMRSALQDLSVSNGAFTFHEGAGSTTVEGKRNVSRKTARRHIARGRRLISVKPKTS